jgi:hypothetical protein
LNWLTHISLFGSYALVLATIAYLTHRRAGGKLLFYSIIAGEALFSFVSGHRNLLVLAFVYVAIVYFYVRRRVPRKWILVGVMALLLSFPLTEVYRKALMGT